MAYPFLQVTSILHPEGIVFLDSEPSHVIENLSMFSRGMVHDLAEVGFPLDGAARSIVHIIIGSVIGESSMMHLRYLEQLVNFLQWVYKSGRSTCVIEGLP